MSVKLAILALLAEEPAHGYALRAEFERRTGGSWPLNIGQVYTTLQRLERDGLVEAAPPAPDGQVIYDATSSGRAMAASWFSEAIERESLQRDELSTKLAIAASSPGVRAEDVIARQRTASMRILQDLTRTKLRDSASITGAEPETIGRALALEAQIFHVEAELRWLDHVEAYLRAAQPSTSSSIPNPAARTQTAPTRSPR